MPDTYTKEQIDEAKAALMGIMTIATATGELTLHNCKQFGADICTVLSALSTAEQERDALAARCAELEARMQGAADRLCAECMKNEMFRPMKCVENKKIGCRFHDAILGEKKED